METPPRTTGPLGWGETAGTGSATHSRCLARTTPPCCHGMRSPTTVALTAAARAGDCWTQVSLWDMAGLLALAKNAPATSAGSCQYPGNRNASSRHGEGSRPPELAESGGLPRVVANWTRKKSRTSGWNIFATMAVLLACRKERQKIYHSPLLSPLRTRFTNSWTLPTIRSSTEGANGPGKRVARMAWTPS